MTIKAVLAYYGPGEVVYRLYQLWPCLKLQQGWQGPLVIWQLPVMAESLPIIPWTATGSKRTSGRTYSFRNLRYALEGVNIERLSLPGTLSLLIGWTGQAASTDSLVNQVGQAMVRMEESSHRDFLQSEVLSGRHHFRPASKGMRICFQAGIAENPQTVTDLCPQDGFHWNTCCKLLPVGWQEEGESPSSSAGGGDWNRFCLQSSTSWEDSSGNGGRRVILPRHLNLADWVWK